MLLTSVDGVSVAEHWTAGAWLDVGFVAGAMGFNVRRILPGTVVVKHW
jgi:ATP-dependent Lhr-like helicase